MTDQRFQIETDGLTMRPRFSRRYAVVDTERLNADGKPMAVLETNDQNRARDYAYECNSERKSSVFIHTTPKIDACNHDFQGWREFPDGRGGERVCDGFPTPHYPDIKPHYE